MTTKLRASCLKQRKVKFVIPTMALSLLFTINILPYKFLLNYVKEVKNIELLTERAGTDVTVVKARRFLVLCDFAVSLANPGMTFLFYAFCGTGLRGTNGHFYVISRGIDRITLT